MCRVRPAWRRGFEGFEHRGVIFGIALVMGEVAVDEEGGGGGRGQNFAAGLGEAVPGIGVHLEEFGIGVEVDVLRGGPGDEDLGAWAAFDRPRKG